MAPRGEAERVGGGRVGRTQFRGGGLAGPGGRRVAGGLAHGRRWTGEGTEQREERERIRGLIQNSNFSQRFFLKHEKL